MQVSGVIGVEGADTFVRPIYAGNAFATVQSKDPVKVLTIRTTAFESAAAGGAAPVEAVAAAADTGLSTVTGQEIVKSDRPELASARVVISGGRGLASGDHLVGHLEFLRAGPGFPQHDEGDDDPQKQGDVAERLHRHPVDGEGQGIPRAQRARAWGHDRADRAPTFEYRSTYLATTALAEK